MNSLFDVWSALERLNGLYGRGDVVSVNVFSRTFIRKPFSCRPETRKFRLVGDTVYALGRQRKIGGIA